MMKWKCLIVDDEPPALKIIKMYADMVEQLEVVATCSNALQAMKMTNEHQIDLIFLDIQMPKLLGTNFLKTLQNPPKVIFTTAHREFATDAFDLDAVDYLLKPISFERFLKAVNKVTLDSVPHEMTSVPQKQGFLYFRSERKMVKVFFDDIQYVESIKDYIKIVRDNQLPPLMVKQSISTLEAMLPSNQFIRIHRSYIASIQKISAYTAYDIEIGSLELPIGRQYMTAVKKTFS
ncbi:LytR/AlgR family response regulator transcription factor, partial [Pedobacter sp.]|uniref:LytR/AlgR family response regulator transcription factor n=1 Tax=Pedobacter sp. TaxID=1411316 RepID=UPI003D7F4249